MSVSEMKALGWEQLDVLIITGDAYVDHPSFGAAIIGRVIEHAGFRVGIVAQPDWTGIEAISVMGTPRLFVGITSGNLDSMLSNYTAARHKRREDVYSEGGATGKRPNHATVVYSQLARRAFPGVPIVIGGMEASMRRVAHFDYWEDKIKPSILADSKADLLVYGMGESAVREILARLDSGRSDFSNIPGTARMPGGKESAAFDFSDAVELPSWEAVKQDPTLIMPLTQEVEAQQSPYCGQRLVQWHGNRAVIFEPPAVPLDGPDLDTLYELPFMRSPHPSYQQPIPGFATIQESVIVSRGCAGGCTFCGLGLHQGKFHSSRSIESVMREIRQMTESDHFHGTVSDLGGPTANLYAAKNGHTKACHKCRRPSCLWPTKCRHFEIDESSNLKLLREARKQPGVKHVFVQSGIRMDVAIETPEYFAELVEHHVSGHLKVAPEHMDPQVLRNMRKPAEDFPAFMEMFFKLSKKAGKKQYLVPYFISSFPGCSESGMQPVADFLKKERWNLQQVQDFIPLPMTMATAMYVAGTDPDGNRIFVAKHAGDRDRQKRMLRPNTAQSNPRNATYLDSVE